MRKLKETHLEKWDGKTFCSFCFRKVNKKDMVKVSKPSRLLCITCARRYGYKK